ncbi:MAG: PDZ domain-containing protein [Acidobacteriota bacterium]
MRSSRLLRLALVPAICFGLRAAVDGQNPAAGKAATRAGPGLALERPAWVGFLWRLRRSSGESPRPTLSVCGVVRSGPADRAGLRGDDLIEEIDANPLPFRSIPEALDYFARLDTTHEHVFSVRRGQESLKIRITAIEMPLERLEEWRSRRSKFVSGPL